MKFLQTKTTWTNAQLIPVKLCIASAYILVGAYFHAFVAKYYWCFLILFVVTVVPTLQWWIRKMRNRSI